MSNKTMYKLTDQNLETHNNTKWELNVWREAPNPSVNMELCSDAWLHGYLSPELAVLLNPMHADFSAPRLFKAEIMGAVKFDRQLKFGAKRMRIIEEMVLPFCTTEQRIRFGILCALECNPTPEFVRWANNWLDGTDRSAASANKAYYAASSAAYAADAASKAANAAYDAAKASSAASWAAYNVDDADNVSYYTARAAYWAANFDKANPNIDLIFLAKKALAPSNNKAKPSKNKLTKKSISSKKKK